MILKFGGMPFEVVFIFEPGYLKDFIQLIKKHGMEPTPEADGYTIEDDISEDGEDHIPTSEKLQALFKEIKESGEWSAQPHSTIQVYADNSEEELIYLYFVHKEVIENALYD